MHSKTMIGVLAGALQADPVTVVGVAVAHEDVGRFAAVEIRRNLHDALLQSQGSVFAGGDEAVQ